MTGNSLFITRRLKLVAEASDEELEASDTIVLDQMDLMATTEFRRLLDPASELSNAIEADLQDYESE